MTLGMTDYAIYDVFTGTALAGNPLAVVFDADDYSGEKMQAIAREFNLSETVFVLKPENPAHTAGCGSSHRRGNFPLPATRRSVRRWHWRTGGWARTCLPTA
jgi:hypothetical protein